MNLNDKLEKQIELGKTIIQAGNLLDLLPQFPKTRDADWRYSRNLQLQEALIVKCCDFIHNALHTFFDQKWEMDNYREGQKYEDCPNLEAANKVLLELNQEFIIDDNTGTGRLRGSDWKRLWRKAVSFEIRDKIMEQECFQRDFVLTDWLECRVEFYYGGEMVVG